MPTIQNAGDMLQLALNLYNIPVKELAIDLGCSVDALYAYIQGKRNIPYRVMKKLASKNIMIFSSVANAATGFRGIFAHQKVNRELQDMLIGFKMQDEEVDEIMDKLPKMLWNKKSHQDLTEKDIETLELFTEKISEWQCSAINILGEIEIRYELSLVKHLQKKENPPALQSRRAI